MAVPTVASPLLDGLVIDAEVLSREVRSSRHTRAENDAIVENRLTTDGFELVMQNHVLEFWFREEVGSARVVDIRSGYVWGSVPVDRPDNLNATWAGIANSLVSIDAFNENSHEAMVGASHDTVERTTRIDGNVLTMDVFFTTQEIGFTFTITLEETGLQFELLDETIVEEGTFLLGSVYFWPFLGATVGNEIPGYIFVPDGPGALIRFRPPTNYVNIFEKRVYGSDLGIDNLMVVNDLQSFRPNDFLAPEREVHFPVFGMVHGAGQNGFFSILENGEEHAFLRAAPAGDRTYYNWVTGRFVYRQIFMQPINRAGAGVRTKQRDANLVNPRQSFHFFAGDEADYVGFARFYRDYLGLESRMPDVGDIPIMLDFILNDVEQGFFFTSERVVTHHDTVREAAAQILGITDNVHINLLGWQRRGLNGHQSLSAHTPRRPVVNLANDLQEMGAYVSFYLNPLRAKEIQISNRSIGTNLSQSPVRTTRDNPNIWLGTDVFARPTLAVDALASQVEALGDWSITLDDIPSRLFSERLRAEPLSRQEVRELFLQEVRNLGQVPMYRPNVYMLAYAASFIATPMVNSQFLFQTDTVPFLQIVLSGTMPLFAPYANVSFASPIDILKHIDYNVFPTFLLTGYENHDLTRTSLADFNSTAYVNWQGNIVFIYQYINSVLGHVMGQEFMRRTVLEEGVVRNQYETGIVLVNYTANEFVYNGVTVAALSALYIPMGGGR